MQTSPSTQLPQGTVAPVHALTIEPQFFPCLVLPLMFWLFAPKYSGTWYWFAAAGWYLLAKVLEFADAAIYSAGHITAGHAIKHLAAAGACYAILRAFQTRQALVRS